MAMLYRQGWKNKMAASLRDCEGFYDILQGNKIRVPYVIFEWR